MSERVTSAELARLWRELSDIEEGASKPVALPDSKGDGWCGITKYRTSGGFVFGVFWDCGEWDYLDFVEFPLGHRVEYEDLPWYRPPDEKPWRYAAQEPT